MYNKALRKIILEQISEMDSNFIYLDKDNILRINDINLNKNENLMLVDITTTYNKNFYLAVKISDFKKWAEGKEKVSNIFLQFAINFFEESKSVENINEIIDDTNEIMPDKDTPPNTTNTHVGIGHTMDLEKIFKRSMPKSVRNYSGNLGLGTVVW